MNAAVADGISVAVVLGFVAQTIRISVPYALGAMGTTFSERGGVINIAAEGIFLNSALAYTLAAHYTGSGWLGVLGAMGAGLATAGLHALVTVTFRADQITSGIGINLLAVGLTRFILKVVFHSSSNSERVAGIPPWEIPGISSLPGIGPLLSTPLVLITMALVVLSWWVLFRTPFGLRLRAVGEHPEAAATLGLSVVRWRYAGVLVSGMLAGLGGAWLASDQRMFTDGMSAGRGYIRACPTSFSRCFPTRSPWRCWPEPLVARDHRPRSVNPTIRRSTDAWQPRSPQRSWSRRRPAWRAGEREPDAYLAPGRRGRGRRSPGD
jgi:simple sugar transport system permease protein